FADAPDSLLSRVAESAKRKTRKSKRRIFLVKRTSAKLLVLVALLTLSFTACNDKTPNSNGNANAGNQPGAVKPATKPQADAQVAVIETADYGKIVVELYPNVAPKMVERFKKLISEKFYDGTAIHRVDPGLGIIQG